MDDKSSSQDESKLERSSSIGTPLAGFDEDVLEITVDATALPSNDGEEMEFGKVMAPVDCTPGVRCGVDALVGNC